MIKGYLRSNPYSRYLINWYHYIKGGVLTRIYTDDAAIKRYYKKYAGKDINLDKPISFSEKLQWLKLYNKNPLKEDCADKYKVREYIRKKGYSELLNELYGVYESIEEINLKNLPEKFVLKATHGSGWNIIVKDKRKVDWFIWKKNMRLWLKQNIYWSGREWVYKGLKPRIIAEKYLEDEYGELRDYKFYCFNGVPQFMQLEAGRGTNNQIRNFYDMDWGILPFGKEFTPDLTVNLKKPYGFEQMKKIASDLASPFEFVRVDLYQANGRIYFGELTFFPAGGKPDFNPPKYDLIVGDLLKLESIE